MNALLFFSYPVFTIQKLLVFFLLPPELDPGEGGGGRKKE